MTTTIVLVSATKTQRGVENLIPAGERFQGELFQALTRYARTLTHETLIYVVGATSAEAIDLTGLTLPSQELIVPNEVWGLRVVGEFESRYQLAEFGNVVEFMLLTDEDQTPYLVEGLRRMGIINEPLKGMDRQEKLAWLAKRS